MTRTRAIELLERMTQAVADGVPLEGRAMLEATYALGYAIEVIRDHTTDQVFARVVSDVATWLAARGALPTASGYPADWPRCHCGQPALDGHLTCGRVECDEAGTRAGG